MTVSTDTEQDRCLPPDGGRVPSFEALRERLISKWCPLMDRLADDERRELIAGGGLVLPIEQEDLERLDAARNEAAEQGVERRG